MIVTKLEKVQSLDGTQSTTMQKFIKGDACQDNKRSQLSAFFKKGLEDGDYVVLYKLCWKEEHKYPKLVFSVNSDVPLKISRCSVE